MLCRILFISTVIALLLTPSPGASTLHAADQELIPYPSRVRLGVVADGRVWTCALHYKEIVPWEMGFTVVNVSFTGLQAEEPITSRSILGHFYSRLYYDFPWCWRISDGQLWLVGSDEFPGAIVLFQRSALKDLIEGQKFPPEVRFPVVRLQGGVQAQCDMLIGSSFGQYYPLDLGVIGGVDVISKRNKEEYDPTRPSFIYDLVPRGKTAFVGFQRIVQGTGKRTQEQPMEVWQCADVERAEWKRIDSFPCHLEEHFHAYIDDQGHYYFVTESGKVYIARKAASGERRFDPLWTDRRRPIHAIVEDADRGKTFVFSKGVDPERGRQRLFYFQLSEKPELKYFDKAELPATNGPAATSPVFEYARLLRERKEL